DRLFAQLTLDDEELRLYDQVRAHMNLDLPPPDLVIYLQAPVETLLARITRRGVAYERLIESSYLQRLSSTYTEFFYHYDAAPLLIVNAAEIDPINNERDYQLLLEQVQKIKSGRHYFNPLSLAV
ncbi:MAG: deoxynucleoside kinase, partial [Gammaproteobacteria bacterium]|nr:deoxynucleoside kinase [Gammaproteobacteria bacterium]